MIKKYEGFFDIFKKKDKVEPVAKKSISYDDATELSNDCFIELIDNGYTVKTGYMGTPYVQITKHPTIRGRLRQDRDIPIKFIDIKNDVLSFCDRLKSIYDIDTKFAFVYENDKGGLSIDYPEYEEIEGGLYDDREVNILTLEINIESY